MRSVFLEIFNYCINMGYKDGIFYVYVNGSVLEGILSRRFIVWS